MAISLQILAVQGDAGRAVQLRRFPARRYFATAETLQGRQCQFPLYEALEIPLLLHRVL